MPEFRYEAHDGLPPEETALVDRGLDAYNAQAAPLHEVQPLSCFVRDASGLVVGGAIGRRWGALCELQQLWVDAGHRGKGLGSRLVQTFEQHAVRRGCRSFYLETLSFQAPAFYRKLGYSVVFSRSGYPHGIGKYHMAKVLADEDPAA